MQFESDTAETLPQLGGIGVHAADVAGILVNDR